MAVMHRDISCTERPAYPCVVPVHQRGAKWQDAKVVTDEGIITSRNPGDLEAFSNKIIEEVSEGRHERRTAA
jgi:protease I